MSLRTKQLLHGKVGIVLASTLNNAWPGKRLRAFEFQMKGPAIIEQMDTTTLIEPDDKVYGDYLGNIFIEVRDFS